MEEVKAEASAEEKNLHLFYKKTNGIGRLWRQGDKS